MKAELDYSKLQANDQAVVIAVITHWLSGCVLMVGVMNEEAVGLTITTGRVTFWSRTKERLWTKGETSGCYLRVSKITVDCDNDTLLIAADPVGGNVCHRGTRSCFD